MRRRDVLVGSVVMAAFGSVSQQAPAQTTPPLRVAVLAPAGRNQYLDAFQDELGRLGYVQGQNLILEEWFANGRADQLPNLAESLVRQSGKGLAAIVAESTPAAVAAQKATATIPIIAVAAVDPVRSGLAASLAHPSANVTGVTLFAEEMNGKRLEVLSELQPIRRLGALLSGLVSRNSSASENLRSLQQAGHERGIAVEAVEIGDVGQLREVLNPGRLAGFDGFVVLPDIVLTSHAAEVAALLKQTSRPVIYTSRLWTKAGGLMSLGPDTLGAYRNLARQLDRVLRGARPGNLPFEQPVKLELTLNLKAARALGIEIPPSLLVRADEVIE